ncbi:MAG: hypothetical protein H8E66_11785 [Planctomycetes bacterium]|nr:hypothetical protein [Planctomycetota bacterium]
MRLTRWTGMMLLVSWAIGCNNSPADPVVEHTEARVSAATPQEVQVDIKSWEEIQPWVASQQGKIVVIDVWSTS